MISAKVQAIRQLLLLGTLCPATVWAVPPPSQLNATELRATLGEAQQRIRSLYVVYGSDDYDDKSLPAGYFLRRVVACQTPDSLFHWTAHGHDMLRWQDDSGQQIARVYNGAIHNEYPLNRSYYKASLNLKEDGLPGTLPNEFLFGTVGFWHLANVKAPRPDGEPFALSEVAQDERYDHVRPFLEEVEGRWCHVLERDDRDCLWLDVEHGCAMLARETQASTTGRLAQRLELGGHSEFAPGIWFPLWIRNIQYDHGSSDPTRQGRIWKNAKHDFLEVRINQDEEDLFKWTPPDGALRVFDNEPSVQTTVGGLEHIDDLADWIVRTHAVTPIRQQRFFPIEYGISIALAIIIAVESAAYAYRRGATSPRL